MKKYFLPFVSWCIIASALLVMSFMLFCITPSGNNTTGSVSIEIPQGSSLNKISRILAEEGVIRGTFRFTVLARLMKIERGLKCGEYRFTLPVTPFALLEKLKRGDVVAYLITSHEGDTIADIARHIEETGLCPGSAILAKARDAQFTRSLGVEGKTLEGYLFPDTYKFNKGTSAEVIVKRMVDQFNKVATQSLLRHAEDRGLSKREVIIIASLIEKETGFSAEKPLIAAVFFNRLKKGMRLDCDPTVIYGLRRDNPAFNERLTRDHLKYKSPYNTYLNTGLPPGPICNPGIDSIKAALNPAPSRYLYFVSKNDGTHHFSETLEQHNQAVARYRRSS